jgi:nitroreductase
MSVIAKREAMSSTEASIVKMAASERFHIFYHAPTVILISADLSKMMPYEDCSAATQNMLLAAESLGIGSCWIGFVKRFYTSTDYNAYKERLAIPSHMTPIHAVSLGYKLQEDLAAPKRKLPKVNFVR